jgi:hypothetical protein
MLTGVPVPRFIIAVPFMSPGTGNVSQVSLKMEGLDSGRGEGAAEGVRPGGQVIVSLVASRCHLHAGLMLS